MSRVERTETPTDRRERDQPRRTQPRTDDRIGHTPTKAEGEVNDVEEALRRQEE